MWFAFTGYVVKVSRSERIDWAKNNRVEGKRMVTRTQGFSNAKKEKIA